MPGRKAVPIEVHKLRGTARKGRHATAIAANRALPDRGVPACPETLSEAAKAIWAEVTPQLAARGVLTAADTNALELLAETIAEWRQLTADLAREGVVYEVRTEAGSIMRRPNPKVAMRSDAQRRLNILLAEFGMTPSSRSKVAPLGEARAQNPFARLHQGAYRQCGRRSAPVPRPTVEQRRLFTEVIAAATKAGANLLTAGTHVIAFAVAIDRLRASADDPGRLEAFREMALDAGEAIGLTDATIARFLEAPCRPN